jgi:hypothetical protein
MVWHLTKHWGTIQYEYCSHTDVPKETLETKLKTADAARNRELKNGYS